MLPELQILGKTLFRKHSYNWFPVSGWESPSCEALPVDIYSQVLPGKKKQKSFLQKSGWENINI